MSRFAEKIIVITGAAQGIGAEFARAFAAEGGKVVVTDVVDGSVLANEIVERGGEAMFVKTDVTSNEDLDALAKTVAAKFGTVDVLINNAAYFSQITMTPFTNISDDDWDKVLRINVRGLVQTSRALVPLLKENGGGRILNVGSGVVFRGPPGMMHYVASKGAVHALNGSMARELGQHNITVNCVAPGLTATENVENNAEFDAIRKGTIGGRVIQRDMLPGDLVGAALFLTSDEASFLTGQILNVDGGAQFH